MKAVSRRLDILRGVRSEDDDDRMIEGEVIDDAADSFATPGEKKK